MSSLSAPRICYTATTFCIHAEKILLVKHKKLKIWLAPGGHLETGELPHEAAIRELQEETGILGEIVSVIPVLPTKTSQNLPLPFSLNLHWISPDNYHSRLTSLNPHQPKSTTLWPKGCEQHLTFNYLAKPISGSNFTFNSSETDDLNWFNLKDTKKLDTKPDILTEIKTAFKLLAL